MQFVTKFPFLMMLSLVVGFTQKSTALGGLQEMAVLRKEKMEILGLGAFLCEPIKSTQTARDREDGNFFWRLLHLLAEESLPTAFLMFCSRDECMQNVRNMLPLCRTKIITCHS